MATHSVDFMIMNFSCHFSVVFQNVLPSSWNAAVKALSTTTNVLLVHHCSEFRRMPVHEKPKMQYSPFCINTYQPLDLGEATGQEKEMERGAQAGGAGGLCTFQASPGENDVHHVLLSPPPQNHTFCHLLRSGQSQHHLTQGQCMRWSHNGP